MQHEYLHDWLPQPPPPPPPPIPPSVASTPPYSTSSASRSTPYLRGHQHQDSGASTSTSTSSVQLPSLSVPSFHSSHTTPHHRSPHQDDGSMAEHRRHWRRGTSTSTRPPQHLQTPPSRRDNNDGYVPYRPPFVQRSPASQSPPVRPSGAQGIGLAPAPVPSSSVQQPPPKRSFFETLFGSRRKDKQQQTFASVSTPALIQHTRPAGFQYPHYQRRQGLGPDPRQYEQPHAGSSRQAIPYPIQHPRYQDQSAAAAAAAVKPSPSVNTGLSAPKMLFSPLSRSLRSDSNPTDPFQSVLSSHPYGHVPHIRHDTLDDTEIVPPSRAYPKIGHNASYQSLPDNKSRWASSNVTLHSEGSRSRLAVSTMCDALTFPRPRMHAHDITPPDSPDAMESEVDEPAPVRDANITDFTLALSQRDAREAERDEWAEIARGRRSGSISRRSSEWSVHGTPVRASSSRHTLTAGEKPQHVRSQSASSSIRSLFRSGTQRTQRFGRASQSHDDLPQTVSHIETGPGVARSRRSNSSGQQSLQSSWQDSRREVPQRSNSRRTLGGVFRRNNSLPKSTSTPTLAGREDRFTPRRSKSVRTHAGSRSNPDLSGHHATPGSPALKRRPTGPPRTFQFRLQPPSGRHGASQANNAGVMVVGSSSGDARLPKLPRTIDFAEPSKLRPSQPSPPPHLPTPERSSPFHHTFDESTIGVAITTDSSQMAPPVKHKLPMDTPPSARPAGIKEDPSSAHARYVLARQHRREQTMRAFQSPPMSPSNRQEKSPTIYPQPLPGQERPSTMYSRTSIYSQQSGYSQPSSISAAFSPAAYPRPEYPTPSRQAAFGRHERDSWRHDRESWRRSSTPPPPVPKLPMSPPLSPKSPTTSWFGRPRPIRSPSPSQSTGARGTSRSKPNTPMRAKATAPTAPATVAPVATQGEHTPSQRKRQRVPESPTPARREKALPMLPPSTGRIPPQRAPPSFPPPPTPSIPASRSASSVALDEQGKVSRSSSSRGHSRQPSDASHFDSSATSLPLSTTTPQVSRTFTESPTPMRKDSLRAATGSGPTAPSAPLAPSKNPRQTPPPGAMPTIMDESPTPIRQTRVSVLAAERASPSTPVPGSLSSASGRQLASSTSSLSSVTGRSLRASSGTPTLGSQRASTPSTLFPIQDPSPGASPLPEQLPSSSRSRNIRRKVVPADSIFTDVPTGAAAGAVAAAAAAAVSGTVGRHTPEITKQIRHIPSTTGSFGTAAEPDQMSSHPSNLSLYSEETSADEWQTPTANPIELQTTGDSDSGLSEATLPDIFGGPISSSSALSHYTDALESPAVEEPEWPAQTPTQPARSLPEEKSAVTPPQTRVSAPSEGPATPPTQIRRDSDSDDNDATLTARHLSVSSRQTVMPETPGDHVESLAVTPTPRPHRSPHSRKSRSPDDTFEFDRTSVSSGSEGSGSVRQSLEENFRGLFFRTPQIPAGVPDRRRSAQLLQSARDSPAPGEFGPIQSSPRALHASLHASPHDFGEGSEGTFELRTPLLGSGGGSGSTGSGSIPFPRGPLDTDTLAPTGLGMSLMSPTSPGVFPPVFEPRLGTPPVSPMPRDDSWISECKSSAAESTNLQHTAKQHSAQAAALRAEHRAAKSTNTHSVSRMRYPPQHSESEHQPSPTHSRSPTHHDTSTPHPPRRPSVTSLTASNSSPVHNRIIIALLYHYVTV